MVYCKISLMEGQGRKVVASIHAITSEAVSTSEAVITFVTMSFINFLPNQLLPQSSLASS